MVEGAEMWCCEWEVKGCVHSLVGCSKYLGFAACYMGGRLSVQAR